MGNSFDPVAALFPNHLAAVIRWGDAEEAYQAVLTAARSGLGSVEITSATPQAFELIARLRAEVGDSCAVGAGTITDSVLAERAVASGAQYLVTPYLAPSVAPIAREAGRLLVMGATTPSEIAQAVAVGAGLVKVFPAAPIGGPAYIQAVRGPMPNVPLWVSGGVGITEVAAYLKVGVRVVGLTNDLFRSELLSGHDWDGIGRLCQQALAAAGVGPAVALAG
ncbi:MAG: bifunctional 4-hydroxy-2-oxoglutarate aldolase/2-dehydro-3-deoxy-phosphogluconate aldolase [Candidatus Dormibacteria bacterium]